MGTGVSATSKQYFVVNRNGKLSLIEPMPRYLKEYATEYNYLFSKIHDCSKILKVDDCNLDLVNNFGNIVRKFLEIHLFFKYPGTYDVLKELPRFFSANKTSIELVNRFCHEGSHGSLERAQRPCELPEEAIKVANIIIEKLQEDKDQFESLVKSIGK